MFFVTSNTLLVQTLKLVYGTESAVEKLWEGQCIVSTARTTLLQQIDAFTRSTISSHND